MGTTFATPSAGIAARLAQLFAVAQGGEAVAKQVRVLSPATRWYAAPACAAVSHRWADTPWNRWSFGWDRETTCLRCGQTRHERAPLHADLVFHGDN